MKLTLPAVGIFAGIMAGRCGVGGGVVMVTIIE